MKKKVLVISAIAAAVLLLTAVAVLVLPLLNSDSPLDGNLKLEKGVLSWDVITDAAGYEVDLGSGGVLVSQNHYDLSANCAYSGEVSITVRAVHRNNGRKDIGNMKVTVNRVAQPIISIEEGETPCFVWSAVENATGYTYDAYDGNGTLTATADEDGRYRVQITNMDEQMIRVTALGGSVDGVVYAANDCLYRYSSSRVFDLSLIAEHPAVYYATGTLGVQEVIKVGTNLPKGTYPMTVTLYASTVSGDKLKGNGTWGRRIVDNGKPRTHLWLCEEAPSADWPDAGGTIPFPDEVVTVDLLVQVDLSSNALILCHDFDQGDMVVIKDLVMDGKSVLNDRKGEPNPEIVIDPFDLSTLGNYPAVYRGLGQWMAKDKSNYEDFTLRVPTKLSDGPHCVMISYYVCGPQGEWVTGNGMWGRRVSAVGSKTEDMLWLNENSVDNYPARNIPFPTVRGYHIFDVEVKNGYFTLECYDFNKDEYFIVESVRLAPVPEGAFDVTTADNYLAYYRGTGEWLARDKSNIQDFIIKIPTELENGQHNVRVNYYVCGSRGEKLTGNGMWCRRVLRDGARDAEMLWLNENQVNDYMPVVLPEPTQLSSFAFDVEVKDGYFELLCYDFDKGDYFIVESVESTAKAMSVDNLTFIDTSNGFVFEAQTTADLKALYEAGTELQMTVKYQFSETSAEDAANAQLSTVTIPVTVDENGRICLHSEQEEAGLKLIIPAGAVIAAKDNPNLEIEIKKEVVLERDASNWGTKDGWAQSVYTDVTLTFQNASNGYIFAAETSVDLPKTYGTWKQLNLTVQIQRGNDAADLENAELEEIQAYFCVDEKGRMLLYGAQEYRSAKLIIPTGTIITPSDQALSKDKLRIANEIILGRNASNWGTADGWQELVYHDVKLTFADTSNGFVFEGETAADLKALYEAGANFTVDAKFQYSQLPDEPTVQAEPVDATVSVTLDENGRICLHLEQEEMGIQLVIPKGTVITPADLSLCNVHLELADDVVLERDVSEVGTKDGWKQIEIVDVNLSFRDASNGYIFDTTFVDDEKKFNLIEAYGTWANNKLELTVKSQYGANASDAESATLKEITAYFNVDDDGRLRLYGAKEYAGIKLEIPAGTVVTPTNAEKSDVRLRIAEDIVLERASSNFGTADGWQIKTSTEEEEIYVDVKLTFKDASNGLVFNVECEEDLETTYGTWKNLDVVIQRKFSKSSVQEAMDAQLENVNAVFNLDNNGYLCLYGAGDMGSVKIVIPAGTIITPGDNALSAVPLRITNAVVLERDASYWQTSDGWQMIEEPETEPEVYTDVKLTFKDASNGLVFNVDCADDLKTTYGTWKNLDVTVQRKFSKSSVQEALDAQLENVNAWFCVDDKGYLCLYGAGDVGSVKIIIPAGTIITPSDKALSDVSIRITNDIVLERDAVYWMTSDGWVQQDTEL